MQRNIAISGKMGAGKTTLYIAIKEQSDQNVVNMKFAKDLYEECYARGMSRDPRLKDRQMLLDVALEMKEKDPEYFVKLTMGRVKQRGRFKDRHFIVIDDLRMPEEFKASTKSGFITVRLKISPETQKKRLKKAYPKTWKTHWQNRNNITETALDEAEEDGDFDYIFEEGTPIKDILSKIL